MKDNIYSFNQCPDIHSAPHISYKNPDLDSQNQKGFDNALLKNQIVRSVRMSGEHRLKNISPYDLSFFLKGRDQLWREGSITDLLLQDRWLYQKKGSA